MSQEALRLPQFDAQIAHGVINDLAARARSADLGDGEYSGMPHQIRELEEHKLFMAMLEVRATERLAGRNVDVNWHRTGKKNDDDNTLLGIEMDGSNSDYDHEFSQNVVDLYAGNAILHTTVAALAESRGLTSLDVLKLIGKPTKENRGGESEQERAKRYVTELNLVTAHKEHNPESAKRMDKVAAKLAKRLIELRKTHSEERQILSVGFQVTDTETGEGNLLFTTTVRNPNSWWGDPQIVWNGEISSDTARVRATDKLEKELAADIVDPYFTKPGLTEYDFWVMPGENGKNVATWNTRKQNGDQELVA